MKARVDHDGLVTCWDKDAYLVLNNLEMVCYSPKAGFTKVAKESGDNQREFRFSTGLWRKDAVIYKDEEGADES